MMQGYSVKKDWFLLLKVMRQRGSLLLSVIYCLQKLLGYFSYRLPGRISKILRHVHPHVKHFQRVPKNEMARTLP
jgi:hypothetical protein